MKKILRKKSNCKGMTIVEVMVVISIFTIGIAGFTMLFSKTFSANRYTIEMGQASFTASQGVNKMVNYIRSARQGDNGWYPITSASNNELIIYSDYDKDGITEKLRFYKNGESVLMGVRDPSGTMPKVYVSGYQETKTIADHVVNGSDTPIFYYFSKNYPGDASAPASINEIRIVKILLKINIIPGQDPDNIEMQSFVEIRNLNDYDRIR